MIGRFALVLPLLVAACLTPERDPPQAVATSVPRFVATTDGEAWNQFVRDTPPLPVWARTLVESLPRTTALQLDLDALHRTRNPLGPILAGRLRWTVADEDHCAYAKESVEADLARAGLTTDQLQRIATDEALPADERAAIAFARKLTTAGYAITDEEVAELIRLCGEDDVVAIVHTIAYANFQNRLFLALGLTAEPGGACPPREVHLSANAQLQAPARVAPREPGPNSREIAQVTGWRELDAAQLRTQLECQKARSPRIDKPDRVRLARLARPDRERVAGTTWGKVSMGYQPVLTTAWFQTMGSFESEAKLDEVFANSVFWVVTRTNKCFY